MIRIILGLILVIDLTGFAFAFKIHNGRLIEHREWTTGSAVLRVNDTTGKDQKKSIKLVFKEMKKDIFSENKNGIMLYNKVFASDETGVVGAETVVSGRVGIYIENFYSNIAKTYKIYSNFCLGEHCARSTYEIQLDPGGFFEIGAKRTVTFNFETPGYYKATLMSSVESDDLPSIFATLDEGSVEIVT